MKKVQWGILGTANIARYAAIPGMQKAESCEMCAIAGRSAEKAAAFAQSYGFRKSYGSYDELIADPEVQAVYIPSQQPAPGMGAGSPESRKARFVRKTDRSERR